MKKYLYILLALLSTNATADEKLKWDGLYGSVLIGYTDGNVQEKNGLSTYTDSSNVFDSDYLHYGSGKASLTGISGTLKIGFNKQFVDNNLIGLELGATFQDADSNKRMYDYSQKVSTGEIYTTDIEQPLNVKTKVNNYQTLAIRFGHIFNEDTLVYALAGGAIGRVERKVTQLGDSNWFDLNYSTTERKTESGYVLGLGVEHKINTKLALRANYEYVDFGNISMTYSGPYTNSDLTNTMKQSHKVDFSNLSVGLTYQF